MINYCEDLENDELDQIYITSFEQKGEINSMIEDFNFSYYTNEERILKNRKLLFCKLNYMNDDIAEYMNENKKVVPSFTDRIFFNHSDHIKIDLNGK